MCPSQGDSFDIDRESSDSPREQTPDSDSGYMASCVTVVSTTSSISKTFQQPRTHNSSIQSSDQLTQALPQNKEENVNVINSQTNAAASNRPHFLAEMQSAQERRRLSKDGTGDSGKSISTANASHYKDVPKHAVPVIPSYNGEIQAAGRGNAFSNSLADQLKSRLEERRRNSDDNQIQDLAADVQKAVNIANESSK